MALFFFAPQLFSIQSICISVVYSAKPCFKGPHGWTSRHCLNILTDGVECVSGEHLFRVNGTWLLRLSLYCIWTNKCTLCVPNYLSAHLAHHKTPTSFKYDQTSMLIASNKINRLITIYVFILIYLRAYG